MSGRKIIDGLQDVLHGRTKFWEFREPDVARYTSPPFPVADNDGPTHLWFLAFHIEDRYGRKEMAATMRALAKRWAAERESPSHE